MKRTFLCTLAAALLGVACGSSSDQSDGTGSVAFSTYGEDYIEKEIPAADVEDGWTIKYSKFLLTLADVAVAESTTAAPVAKMPAAKLFNMTVPGQKAVFSQSLPAKPYTHVSYAILPSTAQTVLGDGVGDPDKQLMVANGYSIYVEGTATKGTASKSFKWGFKTNTLYDRCEAEESGKKTEGVIVTNGGTDKVELTIHGDHLYYDDLQAKEAKVRFDNIAAADANNDNVVTLEELAAVQLASIPPEKGTYGTGSAAGINNLRTFVEALSRTVGHFRGEGECFASAR